LLIEEMQQVSGYYRFVYTSIYWKIHKILLISGQEKILLFQIQN